MKKKYFLDRQKELILDLHYTKRWGIERISKHLGIKHKSIIYKWMKKKGYKINKGNLRKGYYNFDSLKEKILKLYYKDKYSLSEISRKLGAKTTTSVQKWMKRRGYKVLKRSYQEKKIKPIKIVMKKNKVSSIIINPQKKRLSTELYEKNKKSIVQWYYRDKISLTEVAKRLGIKFYGGLSKWLKLKGYKVYESGPNKTKWTKEMDIILKEKYPEETKEYLLNLFKCKWQSIMARAEKLNIKRNKKLFCNTKIFNKVGMTSIEKKIREILDKNNLDYIYNKSIRVNDGVKFPDFRISNLCIEADGKYFHKDKDKKIERDKKIICAGYSILHFSEQTINKNIKKVERCILKKIKDMGLENKNNLTSFEAKGVEV